MEGVQRWRVLSQLAGPATGFTDFSLHVNCINMCIVISAISLTPAEGGRAAHMQLPPVSTTVLGVLRYSGERP